MTDGWQAYQRGRICWDSGLAVAEPPIAGGRKTAGSGLRGKTGCGLAVISIVGTATLSIAEDALFAGVELIVVDGILGVVGVA